MWFITNQHVLAIMGFIALCLSIYGGILTIIERRMNIRNKKRGNRH